jgi:hypothetical protein
MISYRTPWLALALLVGCALGVSLAPAAQAASAPPWRELFNGRDLTGWKLVGGGSKVWIEDGAIVGHMVRGTEEHTLITTDESFGDFILEAECRDVGALHTGFLLRCAVAPADAKIRLFGYQIKIDPTPRSWTGGIFDDFGKSWTWMYDLEHDARARAAYHHGEWTRFRVEAIGRAIKVWVNGVPVTHLLDDKYPRGPLALKVHSLPATAKAEAETHRVHFRNLRIITENPARFAQPMDLPGRAANPPAAR